MNRGFARIRGAAACLAGVLVLLALSGCGHGEDAASSTAPLPALPIESGGVTVSGVSAGGYMAVQLHVAYSALVHGAGVIAAGPYLCAESSMRLALGRCMKGGDGIPTAQLLETTSRLALKGLVDPIAGLADDRVWIFHGAADSVVHRSVVDALETYYRALVDPAQVTRIEHPRAAHTFPTDDGAAAPCDATEPPFLGDCDFDGARALLVHLYGPLDAGRDPDPAGLSEFDQRPDASAAGSAGLAERGWLFVPAGCERGAAGDCRLHVVFHGCKQGASYIGAEFVRRSGYLELAEANRIVLLFPQVAPSFQPLNPNGCWDWWGYEGAEYATQRAPQLRAVRAMIADLRGEVRPGR